MDVFSERSSKSGKLSSISPSEIVICGVVVVPTACAAQEVSRVSREGFLQDDLCVPRSHIDEESEVRDHVDLI